MKKTLGIIAGLLGSAALIFFFFIPAFSGAFLIQQFFTIGPVKVHYYGLVLGLAILVPYLLARKQSWRFGLGADEVDRFAFWLIVVSFLGARLYYVLFNWNYFSAHVNEIWQVWHGGISIFGSIMAGAIFSFIFSRKKAYTYWQLLDLTALVLPLGQAIGRIGNFINYEAFGAPTNLPWKMFVPAANRPSQYLAQEFFHPAFLYELLANLILFCALFTFRKNFKPGQLALTYALSYSAIRFLVEFIRLDVFWVNGLNGNQIMAGLIFVFAGVLIIWKKQAKMV